MKCIDGLRDTVLLIILGLKDFATQKYFKIKKHEVSLPPEMEVVAQSVRASDCGSEGRGFEPPHPPRQKGVTSMTPPLLIFSDLRLFF